MKKIWAWLISPSVVGAIGIVSLVLAIYTAFFYERKPELSISVDAMSKVFDLYRPVGGLEVSYAGENLRSSKKNLWVLTATIKNIGNAEVRKGDYDDKVPLGLEIGGAVIAERPTLKTNVGYLAKNLSISATESRILFSPVILEPGESFEVTTLLLGSESAKPSIVPIGKLAGIKSIALSTPESPSPEKSAWNQAVGATSVWVHLIRWLIYFFGAFLAIGSSVALLAAVMSPFEKLKKQRQAAERQRRVRDYRRHEELGKESRYLMDEYVAGGVAGLAPLARYLCAYTRRRSVLDALSDKLDEEELKKLVLSAVPFRREEGITEDRLKDVKLAEGDGIHVKVSEELGEALADLCRFLKIDLDKLSFMMTNDIVMMAIHGRDQIVRETKSADAV
ncbi:hypothetical protein [Chromobacterium violaceum]|uniref:hypothetical protein n=1 Tax=Chromobacterium violaceum TaxID=536 RepID=UPI0015FAC007|nr:hypothetical protein [Chromobacterium violaceum]MBA8733550.1 hypothetical protein [Chromobacterium violaceum]